MAVFFVGVVVEWRFVCFVRARWTGGGGDKVWGRVCKRSGSGKQGGRSLGLTSRQSGDED